MYLQGGVRSVEKTQSHTTKKHSGTMAVFHPYKVLVIKARGSSLLT